MNLMKNHEGYHDPTAGLAIKRVMAEKTWPKELIYVCSKFRGDITENVYAARRYCKFVISKNKIPLAPHLFFPQFLNDDIHRERKIALDMGLQLISKCDELWVFGEKFSEGMSKEIDHARKIKKDIKHFTKFCKEVRIYAYN